MASVVKGFEDPCTIHIPPDFNPQEHSTPIHSPADSVSVSTIASSLPDRPCGSEEHVSSTTTHADEALESSKCRTSTKAARPPSREMIEADGVAEMTVQRRVDEICNEIISGSKDYTKSRQILQLHSLQYPYGTLPATYSLVHSPSVSSVGPVRGGGHGRTKFSPYQVSTLEQVFASGNFKPTRTDKDALSAKIGLSFDQVNRWFGSRRRKQREQASKAGTPQQAANTAHPAVASASAALVDLAAKVPLGIGSTTSSSMGRYSGYSSTDSSTNGYCYQRMEQLPSIGSVVMNENPGFGVQGQARTPSVSSEWVGSSWPGVAGSEPKPAIHFHNIGSSIGSAAMSYESKVERYPGKADNAPNTGVSQCENRVVVKKEVNGEEFAVVPYGSGKMNDVESGSVSRNSSSDASSQDSPVVHQSVLKRPPRPVPPEPPVEDSYNGHNSAGDGGNGSGGVIRNSAGSECGPPSVDRPSVELPSLIDLSGAPGMTEGQPAGINTTDTTICYHQQPTYMSALELDFGSTTTSDLNNITTSYDASPTGNGDQQLPQGLNEYRVNSNDVTVRTSTANNSDVTIASGSDVDVEVLSTNGNTTITGSRTEDGSAFPLTTPSPGQPAVHQNISTSNSADYDASVVHNHTASPSNALPSTVAWSGPGLYPDAVVMSSAASFTSHMQEQTGFSNAHSHAYSVPGAGISSLLSAAGEGMGEVFDYDEQKVYDLSSSGESLEEDQDESHVTIAYQSCGASMASVVKGFEDPCTIHIPPDFNPQEHSTPIHSPADSVSVSTIASSLPDRPCGSEEHVSSTTTHADEALESSKCRTSTKAARPPSREMIEADGVAEMTVQRRVDEICNEIISGSKDYTKSRQILQLHSLQYPYGTLPATYSLVHSPSVSSVGPVRGGGHGRTKFSPYQVSTLEQVFASGNFKPTRTDKDALSAKIGLSFDQVNRWFGSRRRKQREQASKAGTPQQAANTAHPAVASASAALVDLAAKVPLGIGSTTSSSMGRYSGYSSTDSSTNGYCYQRMEQLPSIGSVVMNENPGFGVQGQARTPSVSSEWVGSSWPGVAGSEPKPAIHFHNIGSSIGSAAMSYESKVERYPGKADNAPNTGVSQCENRVVVKKEVNGEEFAVVPYGSGKMNDVESGSVSRNSSSDASSQDSPVVHQSVLKRPPRPVPPEPPVSSSGFNDLTEQFTPNIDVLMAGRSPAQYLAPTAKSVSPPFHWSNQVSGYPGNHQVSFWQGFPSGNTPNPMHAASYQQTAGLNSNVHGMSNIQQMQFANGLQPIQYGSSAVNAVSTHQGLVRPISVYASSVVNQGSMMNGCISPNYAFEPPRIPTPLQQTASGGEVRPPYPSHQQRPCYPIVYDPRYATVRYFPLTGGIGAGENLQELYRPQSVINRVSPAFQPPQQGQRPPANFSTYQQSQYVQQLSHSAQTPTFMRQQAPAPVMPVMDRFEQPTFRVLPEAVPQTGEQPTVGMCENGMASVLHFAGSSSGASNNTSSYLQVEDSYNGHNSAGDGGNGSGGVIRNSAGSECGPPSVDRPSVELPSLIDLSGAPGMTEGQPAGINTTDTTICYHQQPTYMSALELDFGSTTTSDLNNITTSYDASPTGNGDQQLPQGLNEYRVNSNDVTVRTSTANNSDVTIASGSDVDVEVLSTNGNTTITGSRTEDGSAFPLTTPSPGQPAVHQNISTSNSADYDASVVHNHTASPSNALPSTVAWSGPGLYPDAVVMSSAASFTSHMQEQTGFSNAHSHAYSVPGAGISSLLSAAGEGMGEVFDYDEQKVYDLSSSGESLEEDQDESHG